MEENKAQNTAKSLFETGDSLIGDTASLASNKVAPVVGPILIQLVWKNKWKILIGIVCILLLCVASFEALAYQVTASSRSLLEDIPQEHRECIDKASFKYGIEFELLASFGKVISDFSLNHTGTGEGFLEIETNDWSEFGSDGNDNKVITKDDICDNYFTLANKLGSIQGDSYTKIQKYSYPNKEDVKDWYEIYKGVMSVPYGNPIGLDRVELASISSGYDIVRIIYGKKSVHKGVDLVPSYKWYQENPGKASIEVVNHSIIFGKVTNSKDGNGALCSEVANDRFKVLYCHCSAFIAKDQIVAKYGYPICFMGSTGLSSGVHVHVGMFQKDKNGSWNVIDPTPFMFPT
ncbi:MAG: hypothetical protein JW870_04945 [Candidatus Delongbacteria bacterium]|nr:hypothetical protein [Candidatus Delongbacteria bacterium]